MHALKRYRVPWVHILEEATEGFIIQTLLKKIGGKKHKKQSTKQLQDSFLQGSMGEYNQIDWHWY